VEGLQVLGLDHDQEGGKGFDLLDELAASREDLKGVGNYQVGEGGREERRGGRGEWGGRRDHFEDLGPPRQTI
jgi:hypothetical protein